MEVPHWGEAVESYEVDTAGARGVRTLGLVGLAAGGGGAAWLTSRTEVGLFEDGLFLVPALLVTIGLLWVWIGSASRVSMWVGEGWYAQRTGLVGDVRGFHLEEVARVRTGADLRSGGRRFVTLVIETLGGQRHRVPFTDVPMTRSVRRALARQLLASDATIDPKADVLLRAQGAGEDDAAPPP